MRMATVPQGTRLMTSQPASFPILQLRNVFILPGVPRLMQQKFEQLAPEIAGDAVHCIRVYARNAETMVAASLGEIAHRFPDVAIGSYPRFGREDHQLIVTLECTDEDLLRQAHSAVASILNVVKAVGP
jgi:molybdopterin-biosynthesis enzyme MoeA-like protein